MRRLTKRFRNRKHSLRNQISSQITRRVQIGVTRGMGERRVYTTPSHPHSQELADILGVEIAFSRKIRNLKARMLFLK